MKLKQEKLLYALFAALPVKISSLWQKKARTNMPEQRQKRIWKLPLPENLRQEINIPILLQ